MRFIKGIPIFTPSILTIASHTSNFPESSRVVYVHGILVPFDPSVIYMVLELGPFFTSVLSSYNLVTCQYDMIAYHREAYVDSSILLVNDQVSKSHL